jgi:hypothetical protein
MPVNRWGQRSYFPFLGLPWSNGFIVCMVTSIGQALLSVPILWEMPITQFITHFNRYYLFPFARFLPLGALPSAKAWDGFGLGCKLAKGH